MKKKKNFIVLIAIALLFILAVPVSAASGTMKLNRTQVSMYVTESTTIRALDSRGKTKSASWRSSNTRIATVKNGVITAKKAGTVTITATSNGVKRSCKVTVRSDWYQKVLRSYGASYRVRNNWDDRVEMEAQGSRELLAQMVEMLGRQRFIEIEGIEERVIPVEVESGFYSR